MTPRHRRLGVIVGIALFLPMLTASGSSADPIADKKAEAARIQDQLDKQGDKVSILAERSNRAQLKVAEVDDSLNRTQADVARSDDRLKVVKSRLAQAAVLAYVHSGSSSMLSSLARGGKDDMIVRTQYLRVTASDQRQIIGEVRAAREDFQSQKLKLDGDRKAAQAAAGDAASASRAAAQAEEAQRAVLGQVKGDLADLVNAEQARKEAEAARNAPVLRLADPRVADAPAPPSPAAAQGQAAPSTTTTVAAARTPAASAPATSAPAVGKGAAAAVAEARRQLGKPYVYGGSGPDSFDCSGLTMWSWRAGGVSLSHSAYDQWFETTRVPINSVQPGDLLFFGDNGVESIHHNAIYIGDGQMIEASQTGTPVRIRGWRSVDLVGAGRPG